MMQREDLGYGMDYNSRNAVMATTSSPESTVFQNLSGDGVRTHHIYRKTKGFLTE